MVVAVREGGLLGGGVPKRQGRPRARMRNTAGGLRLWSAGRLDSRAAEKSYLS